MKKIVAFLLCLCMLLSLSACFSFDQKGDKTGTFGSTSESTPGSSFEGSTKPGQTNPEEGSHDITETPSQMLTETRYYKIEKTDAGKTKYEIYGLDGKVVLSGETGIPLAIYMFNERVVEIRLGKEPTDVRKFYDLINNCFSEDYSNLLTHTAELAVCVEKESNGTVLVAKSLFGNDVYKTLPQQNNPSAPLASNTASFG